MIVAVQCSEMHLCTIAISFLCWTLVRTQPFATPSIGRDQLADKHFSELLRNKRNGDHEIAACIHMSFQEGQYYYKAGSQPEGATCGVYIFADADQRIELHFNYVDVECDNGGLVAFVDGWELNGQFFPNAHDHSKPPEERFSEFCGHRNVKRVFASSQNVALVQYRIPSRLSSFSFTVHFVPNATPCNVLLQDVEDVFTLRNYGKRSNCSISALFPAVVRVLAVNVGVEARNGHNIQMETGTLHKCQKRGFEDYAQIGGSSGLDNSGLLMADSVCGLDSKPGKISEVIGCETSTVRLVSSGVFDNAITIAMRQLTEEDTANYMSVFCPMEATE